MSTLIEALMAEGYSLACATCRNLHTHRTQGLPGCAATPGSCGCPLDGKALSHYKGPVDLAARCYICGEEASDQVSNGGPRRLGICPTHRAWLATQRTPHILVLHHGGPLIQASSLRRKSLAAYLASLPPLPETEGV